MSSNEMFWSGRTSRKLKYLLFFVAVLLFLVYVIHEGYNKENESRINIIDITENGINLESKFEHDTRNSSIRHSLTQGNTILIIFWTTFFGETPKVSKGGQYKWPFYYVGPKCPVKCELTTKKHRIHEASAIVFHSRDINVDDLPPTKLKGLPWILQTHENPVYTPLLRDSAMMSKFNFLVSYRLDSDFPSPEFLKPSLKRPLSFRQKTGLVLAVYSNCEILRTHYMIELKKHIEIDFYGNCLRTHKFLKRTEDHGDTKLQTLIRKYKFALVFPNADCNYYMTEKITFALSAGSVPVWLGTDKIDEVLQWGNLKKSVIKVKDFPTPEKLASYLNFLAKNETEYNKYLKWKYEGFQFPPDYYKSAIGQWWEGLPVYCRVCMRVARGPKGHNGLQTESCSIKSGQRLAKLIKS